MAIESNLNVKVIRRIIPNADSNSVIASPNRIYIHEIYYSVVACSLLEESDIEFITILNPKWITRMNFIRKMWHYAASATGGILTLSTAYILRTSWT